MFRISYYAAAIREKPSAESSVNKHTDKSNTTANAFLTPEKASVQN